MIENPYIMTVRENIATNIRTLRTAAGMPQKTLGNLLGLGRPAISEIESTKRGVSIEECIGIAKIFGVEPERVYGSSENLCPACGQPRPQPEGGSFEKVEPSAPGSYLKEGRAGASQVVFSCGRCGTSLPSNGPCPTCQEPNDGQPFAPESIEVEKDGRRLFAGHGCALDRALSEGWTEVKNGRED